VACTFKDGKLVFTLKTGQGSPETTGKDVQALRRIHGPKVNEGKVDFNFEQLDEDYELVDAVADIVGVQ
jgi:hypothetical protein